MPLNFCLPKDRVDAFIGGLKNGEIDPAKMLDMTSKERNELFSKFVGKDAAKRVNAEFEAKTLLKNQEQGMVNWAKNVTGIKPPVRRDLIEKIKNLDRVLDPEDKSAFLEDLASVRLKADVTQEEAQAIADMSRGVQKAKSKMSEDYTFPTQADRLDYGRAVVRMEDYVSDLKNETNKMTLGSVKDNPLGSAGRAVLNTAGFTKSLTASLDNSVIGRQGLKVLFTHPKIWAQNSAKTFIDFAKTLKNKDAVMQEVRAEIASRPNALNGLYRREKLALWNNEEAFPSSLPEKIPVFGRFFKGSETAFTGFQYRTRADLMDLYAKVAERTGGDIKGFGQVANTLTGRGNLGKLEPVADVANNLMFSPRFLKSNIDALTGQVLDYGKLGSAAKKEAAKNTLKIILGIGSIIGATKAINPGAIELDPRSTDFGKIRVGDTRFDIAGGMAGLVTLASRMITQESKSGTSDKISKLNEVDDNGKPKFGGRSTLDVFYDFLEGKASPTAGVGLDLLRGSDFKGDKVTLTGELKKVLVPIGVQNLMGSQGNPNAANIFASTLLDGLGIGSNTIPVSNIKSGAIPEGVNTDKGDLVNLVKVYADALGTDPETAFNRMFSGQRIRRVDNGTIVVERLPLEKSTEVKKKGGGNNPTMKLDHTLPLQLGGGNEEANLKLVPTSEWQSYTPVENALGRALRSGKVSKSDAQSLIKRFKNKEIKAEDIVNKYK